MREFRNVTNIVHETFLLALFDPALNKKFAFMYNIFITQTRPSIKREKSIDHTFVFQVASRRVFQAAALIMIFCGIFGKIGAFLATIPDPVIGGLLLIDIGLVISIGLAALQFCDMSSLRNMTIVAISFMTGLVVPNWLMKNPNALDSG